MSRSGSDRADDGRSGDDPSGGADGSTGEYRSPASPNAEGVYGAEFDGGTVYRTRYDPTVRKPSTIVLAMVAAVMGEPVEELEPLWPTVDLEALDRLFPKGGANGTVQFHYQGTEVTVCDEGTVTVRALDDSLDDLVGSRTDGN